MFLTLGLKLLGIGKFLRDFFLANWKWVLPILAAGFLGWAAWTWHSNAVDAAYAKGVVAERSVWLKKIDEENARNRQLEFNLSQVINKGVEKAVEESAQRSTSTNTHTNTIKTIIQRDTKYEQCVIDQNVLDEINAIRELGPK